MFSSIRKIHFVGIGGIGMSGIAEILINQGFEITGSDMASGENTQYLEKLGAKIFLGHRAENIEGAEAVVYSSAVNIMENPETLEAMNKKIPVIRRAEMLSEVTRLNYCIAVSGTHGKTTTTSMVALILIKANIDPTVIVGGRLKDFGGTNARLGKGNWTVVEADEYDRSFLQLFPTIAIVNNIEPEHLDIYKDLNDIKNTFLEFANKVPFYGFVAVGMDDLGARDILSSINKKVVTYGLSRHCQIRAINPKFDSYSTVCTIVENDIELGELELNVPGIHNLKNALAAITVARHLKVEFSIIAEALKDFKGVQRRFESKGEFQGAIVIDDYAHHPSEVKATLEAARNGWDKRIIAVFQPHTFTRTRDLYKEFGQSFDDADVVVITDVYPARELPIEGVTGKLISDATTKFGHKNVIYIPNIDEVYAELQKIVKNGDLLLTMGAGSIFKLSNKLVEKQ